MRKKNADGRIFIKDLSVTKTVTLESSAIDALHFKQKYLIIFNKFSGPTSLSFNIGQSFSGVHHNNNTEIL